MFWPQVREMGAIPRPKVSFVLLSEDTHSEQQCDTCLLSDPAACASRAVMGSKARAVCCALRTQTLTAPVAYGDRIRLPGPALRR